MKSKGCNGFAYTMDYATQKEKMDVEVEQDGL
jgi:Fe-S cluster assembly iron-binding protein IscA